MLYPTSISSYKDENGNFEQITISAEFTERRALLTRTKGAKVWAVRGRLHDADGKYDIKINAGAQKTKAIDAAKWFVNFG